MLRVVPNGWLSRDFPILENDSPRCDGEIGVVFRGCRIHSERCVLYYPPGASRLRLLGPADRGPGHCARGT